MGIRSRQPGARRALLALAITIPLVAVYIVRALTMNLGEVLRSDFISQLVAGNLVRAGLGAHLYDAGSQWPFYAALTSANHGGDLLFNHAPLSAVMAIPFGLVGPVQGHLLWSLLQLLMLAAACALVARAAPWPGGASRHLPLAAVMVAVAGAGTLPLLLEGQGVGEIALSLGCAYWCWRRDRMALGGAAFVAGAAVAKPHLALGLIAFLAAWRQRRVLAGAVAAAAAALALSVLAVGWTGVVGFLRAAVTSAGIAPPTQFFGVTGLVARLLGPGSAAAVAGLIAAALTLIGAGGFGVILRHAPRRLEFALGGATALSLAASPHLWSHDLALLAPVSVAALAAAARSDGPLLAWPGRTSRVVLELWLLLCAAVGGDTMLSIPIRFTPIVLLLMGWCAWRAIRLPRVAAESVCAPAEPSRSVQVA